MLPPRERSELRRKVLSAEAALMGREKTRKEANLSALVADSVMAAFVAAKRHCCAGVVSLVKPRTTVLERWPSNGMQPHEQ